MSGRAPGGGVWAGFALLGITSLLLALEFLLGMYVNLYDASLPNSIEHVFGSGLAMSALAAHVTLGILLGVFALLTLLWAVMRRRLHVAAWAMIGLLGVLLAAVGGDLFLMNQQPAWSFTMALGFLISFGAYTRAAGVLARHRMVMPPMASVAPMPP